MIYIDEMRLKRTAQHYELRVRTGEFVIEQQTDEYLGTIMSAFSACLKAIALHYGVALPDDTTELRCGTIRLDTWEIEQTGIAPIDYRMTMISGPYTFEATSDKALENVIRIFAAAMKFFAFKYKLITLDDEVARNRDVALGWGLVNDEDCKLPTHTEGHA